MSTVYKSCNQSVKDYCNSEISRYIAADSTSEEDCAITLDHIDNGTFYAFSNAGFRGHLVVVQNDRDAAVQQLENWINTHGPAKFAVHHNDIANDLDLYSLWTQGRPVRLWNFDVFGTWLMVENIIKRLIETPQNFFHSSGTFVAFTFMAVPHSLLINRINHRRPDTANLWTLMQSARHSDVHRHYTDAFDKHFVDAALPCTTVTRRILRTPPRTALYHDATGVIYGGDERQCNMLFVLFHVVHADDCRIDHRKSQSHKIPLKRKHTHDDEVAPVDLSEISPHLASEEFNDKYNAPQSDTEDDFSDYQEELDDDDAEYYGQQLGCITKTPTKLWDHQTRMIDAIRSTQTRGYIRAVCGSGKSLVQVICCADVPISAILVPRKILVEQFYQQYLQTDSSIDTHRVNSDHMNVIPLPNPKRKTLYLVNFDSVQRLANSGITFDLVIWDEAHLATSARYRSHMQAYERAGPTHLKGRRHLFFTATPNENIRKHPESFGPELFSYTFKQAVDDHIIKTINTYVDCMDYKTADTIEKLTEQCLNFIDLQHCKRTLIYVNRVAGANDIVCIDTMKANKRLFGDHRVDFLSAKTKNITRNAVFDRFMQKDDEVHIIVSCNTISVGIDLPSCDSVIFASPCTNAATILQRGLRPCRLTHEERLAGASAPAKIFFPINVKEDVFSTLVHSGKHSGVHLGIRGHPLEGPMALLNMLKNGLDVELKFTTHGHSSPNETSAHPQEERCDIPRTTSHTVTVSFSSVDIVWEEDTFNSDMNHLCVTLQNEKNETSFDTVLEKMHEFCAEYNRLPSNGGDAVEDALAIRSRTWKIAEARRQMSQNHVRMIETLMGPFGWQWVESTRYARKFNEDVQTQKAFMLLHKRGPMCTRDSHEHESCLWRQVHTWRKSKNKNEMPLERQKEIEEHLGPLGWRWTCDRDEEFEKQVARQVQFAEKHGRIASHGGNATREEKTIACVNQRWRRLFSEGKLSEERIRLANEQLQCHGWTWMTLDMQVETKFEEDLLKAKNFLLVNGRLAADSSPDNDEGYIGRRQSYWRSRKRKGKLSDLHINAIENALVGWEWDKSPEGRFRQNITKILKFCKANNRLPKQSGEKTEQSLGRVLGAWRTARRRGKLSELQVQSIDAAFEEYGMRWD